MVEGKVNVHLKTINVNHDSACEVIIYSYNLQKCRASEFINVLQIYLYGEKYYILASSKWCMNTEWLYKVMCMINHRTAVTQNPVQRGNKYI